MRRMARAKECSLFPAARSLIIRKMALLWAGVAPRAGADQRAHGFMRSPTDDRHDHAPAFCRPHRSGRAIEANPHTCRLQDMRPIRGVGLFDQICTSSGPPLSFQGSVAMHPTKGFRRRSICLFVGSRCIHFVRGQEYRASCLGSKLIAAH